MRKKTSAVITGQSVIQAHLRLNKLTALMLASAILSTVSLHADAQALANNLSGNVDGTHLQRGYLITGDERFDGATSSVQIGTTKAAGPQSLVQNFRTVGGAGSGGGQVWVAHFL